MALETLQTSWLARFLGEPYLYITLKEDGIELRPKRQGLDTQLFNVSELISFPLISPGIFRNTLVLPTSQGKFTIRGLTREATKLCIEWFEEKVGFSQGSYFLFCLRWQKMKWYKKLEPQVSEALNQIERIFNQGFLRTSRWEHVQSIARSALELFQEAPPEGLLPKELEYPFIRVKEISEENSEALETLRREYIQRFKQEYSQLLDEIESNPLTERQRDACIIDEDNNLVLAGAGTGKTSTMVGRVAFLIQSGQAKPEEVLMLAFGNKAAEEMRERLEQRVGIEGITAATFHALGSKIMAQAEGGKPSISKYAEDEKSLAFFVDTVFNELLLTPSYKQMVLDYFEDYLFPEENPFDFETEGDYFNYIKVNEIRSLQAEKVKSFEESRIANYLFKMGISYVYEAPYRIDTRTLDFRTYKPDFYLPDYDIYIEHFGIDREDNTAPYIDKAKYLEGIQWKKSLHLKHKTILIETYHYEQQEHTLLDNLKQKLQAHNVTFNPMPDENILETLKDFGAITSFSDLLAKLLSLYKACWLEPGQLDKKIQASKYPNQVYMALELLKPIFERYQKELTDQGEIDFNDMIGKAIHYVQANRFHHRWRYILVDEFQDISEPRARLIKALRDQVSDSSLFCVGDDWQSIYRFTGSDIILTTSFQEYFGPTITTALDKTFRFNNSICDIASRFVTQNPVQVKKTITTHHQVDQPAVSLLRIESKFSQDQDKYLSIYKVLDRISEIAKPGSSVYILGRYNFLLPTDDLGYLRSQYSTLKIDTMSMHKSKGKEADYIIVLGLVSGKSGFPSEKITHPLLEALLPEAEPFPDAEERRLFYVAITRAKKRTYLITDMANASRFIHELLEDNYPIELNEFEISLAQKKFELMSCIICESGSLVKRTGKTRHFYGCSHYPLCEHLENGCPECEQPMKRETRFKVCISDDCDSWIPICPICGAEMKEFRGSYGAFWGCRNYKGKEANSCTYKEQQIEYSSTVR